MHAVITATCFPQRQKTLLSYCTHALTLLYLLPDEISTRPLEMLTNRRPCGKSGLGAGQADTERQIEMAERWNNILIYLRGEQWPLCFWSTLSWTTPKQRGRERSHLQLLVTNMAVIRQRWPSQDCRPTLPLPPLPSAHTQKGSLFVRALNTGRLQTLSSRLVYRLILKGAVSDARGRLNMAGNAPDTCWSLKRHLLWPHTSDIICHTRFSSLTLKQSRCNLIRGFLSLLFSVVTSWINQNKIKGVKLYFLNLLLNSSRLCVPGWFVV